MNKKTMAIIAASSIIGATLLAESKQTVDGTVVPMVTMDIGYGLDQLYKGFIDYVMPAGTFFYGPVYDSKGNCVREGDIIATINPDYAKLQYQAASLAYKSAKDQYERDLKSGEAVSKRALVADQISMLQAEATSQMSKIILENVCTLRARFNGYVNEVKFAGGWASGLPATINVSQLDPIYISIPITESVASQTFNYNTPVTVYPTSDKIGAEPVGYIQGRSADHKSGNLLILVNNKPLPPPVKLTDANGKKIPVLHTWCPVIEMGGFTNYQYDEDSVIVSKHSLFGKDGDYYVWMVEDSKSGIAGKGMNYLNKVKKVAVNTDGKIISVPSYVGMVTFTPKDEKIKDIDGMILLSNQDCPSDLKDGDTICLYAGMYTFMPGDKVKVDIGPTPGVIQ
ncbi:MAG TPA: hypothetical protein DD381_09645 [Lentisphaeria bacterium]|nr:MAG: hypothetical protein A2X47_07520 [Lentisphaerae bacterium GWF2_38_69]HBM16587.1 hypothetical protein [Lentisphaeria bacterium]